MSTVLKTQSPMFFVKLVAAVAGLLLLSGCILRTTGGLVFTDDLGTFIDLQFDNVSVAYCRERPNGDGMTSNECLYSVASPDGFGSRTSTSELLSEFGLFGLLVDPLILQVPVGSVVNQALVDDGNGQQPLRITETAVVDVQPGVQIEAEAGHVLWIIELPVAVEERLIGGPLELDYAFSFHVPVLPEADGRIPFKALLTGRVDAGTGTTYYIPLFPCMTDLADVPEIRVPATNNLFGFIFELLNLMREPVSGPPLECQDQVYDFSSVVAEDPPVVADLEVSSRRSRVSLSWSDVAADSYKVYRATSAGGPYTLVGTTTSGATSFADRLPHYGVTRYYRVTSVLGGQESAPSNEVSATFQLRRARR